MAKMLKAQVAGLQLHQTARGERIYALFTTSEGQTMGIWAPADDALISQLHAGDWVHFQRNAHGAYHLYHKI